MFIHNITLVYPRRGRQMILKYNVCVLPIDLVSIDPQSGEKRNLDLMDTVNAKKGWATIYWRVNKFLK
jgi:hypothetical protein